MTRRKDKPRATPPLTPGQELFRRVLLGVVTAIVVARPLVATEDPGLRSALPDASGPALTWLWLVALLGWSIYHFWTGQGGARFGIIEAALLIVVGCNLLSAWFVASYKYTAWLATWEWFSFFIAFFLVRRLATGPGAAHGLLAALIASVAALSVYAAYQHLVEIPQAAKLSRSQLKAEMAKQGEAFELDDPRLAQLEERARSPNVFATFAVPNSFAGYLGLFLPVMLAWTIAAWRGGGWTWRTELAGACTALAALALWWTHSRGAILATLLVAAVVLVWFARRFIALRQLRAVAGLAILAVAIGLLAYFGMHERTVGKITPRASFDLRLGYWNATWKMIEKHPGLGVGPGNFGRHYPEYMTQADFEEVQDPHNFALELWATCGFFGMAALLVALGVFFWRTLRAPTVHESEPPIEQRTPWELYLGGMAGLTLGFLLSISPQDWTFPAEATWWDKFWMFVYAYHAPLVRSVIWFPALALFLGIRWNGPARTFALVAGVAILLLNLCISGGIALPAVATSLWIVIALALASLPAPGTVGDARGRAKWAGQFAFLARVLPVPICAALVMWYGATFVQPIAQGARLARRALDAGQKFSIINQPQLLNETTEAWARQIQRNPVNYLRQYVLRPLQAAAEANPEDARYRRWLADWTGVIWQLTHDSNDRTAALDHIYAAQVIDPRNREVWLTEAHLLTMFGRHLQLQAWRPILAISTPWGPFWNIPIPPQPAGAYVRIFQEPAKTKAAQTAHTDFDHAAKSVGRAVALSPTQPRLRYQLVEGLLAAGQVKQAELEARQVIGLDNAAHRWRKLTPPQREQVRHWLASRQGK